MLNEERKDFLTKFGARIRQYRLKKGMTLEELANKIGYMSDNARSSLQKIEAGNSDIPASKVYKLSKALEVPVSVLMGWEEDHVPVKTENNKEEKHVINNYRSLNQDGQTKLIDYSDDLVSSGRYNKEETVKVFMAARNGAKPGIVEIKKSLMDKIKNAPTVESDDDI